MVEKKNKKPNKTVQVDLMIIGNSEVGKTSIMHKHCLNRFNA